MLEYVYVTGIAKKEFEWENSKKVNNIWEFKKFLRKEKLRMMNIIISETIDGEKNKEFHCWDCLQYDWNHINLIHIVVEDMNRGTSTFRDIHLYRVRGCN